MEQLQLWGEAQLTRLAGLNLGFLQQNAINAFPPPYDCLSNISFSLANPVVKT